MTDTNPFAPYLHDQIGTDDYEDIYRLYPDDARWLAELLRNEWTDMTGLSPQDLSANIPIYYDTVKNSTRDNRIGSILVYESSGMRLGEPKGLSFESVSPSKTLAIDIQNPMSRDRHRAWVLQVLSILSKYRKSGRMKLDGWDMFTITSVADRNNYVGYYQTVIEISLKRAISDLPYNGLALNNNNNDNDNTTEQ